MRRLRLLLRPLLLLPLRVLVIVLMIVRMLALLLVLVLALPLALMLPASVLLSGCVSTAPSTASAHTPQPRPASSASHSHPPPHHRPVSCPALNICAGNACVRHAPGCGPTRPPMLARANRTPRHTRPTEAGNSGAKGWRLTDACRQHATPTEPA